MLLQKKGKKANKMNKKGAELLCGAGGCWGLPALACPAAGSRVDATIWRHGLAAAAAPRSWLRQSGCRESKRRAEQSPQPLGGRTKPPAPPWRSSCRLVPAERGCSGAAARNPARLTLRPQSRTPRWRRRRMTAINRSCWMKRRRWSSRRSRCPWRYPRGTRREGSWRRRCSSTGPTKVRRNLGQGRQLWGWEVCESALVRSGS